MPFSLVPPPPPPPDHSDDWLRFASDVLGGLTWQPTVGELGRWFTAAGEPTQLVLTQDKSGRVAVALMLGLQPDRIDVLLSAQTAEIAQACELAPEPRTAVTYNGQAYVFRLARGAGDALELAAVAV